MMAKSQDIVVLLKWLCCPELKNYADLAKQLGMSVGEVHGATQRSGNAGLFNLENRTPLIQPLKEYLVHGVKYAFPALRGAPTRGIPTSYAALPLSKHFSQNEKNDLPPVWPDPEGKVRGYAIEPLFRSVPYAVRQDSKLYELLALLDALREGRARERQFAASELDRQIETLARGEKAST